MILNDVFPSKYVKAADIKGKGDVPVVIADAQIEKLGEDRKLVIYFQNKEKGLVCNKTNANRISYLYGDDTDGWIGKEISLGVEFVDYQGKTMEAIRVKPPVQRESAKPAHRSVVTQKAGYQLSGTEAAPPDELEKIIGPTPPPVDAPF